MTPAKLWALMKKRQDSMYLYEGPIAHLSWLFYNANKDPGDKKEGRPPAPAKTINDFRLYALPGGKQPSLAAKDERDYTMTGAVADKSEWVSYSRSKGVGKTKRKNK